MSRSSMSNEGRTGTVSVETGASQGIRPGALSRVLEEVAHQPDPAQAMGWPTALHPGAVIGRFELVREVGHGGFGVVYEARDRELGRLVAFKAVRPGVRRTVREERLLCEAETAARLSHPNIVTLFDAGRAPEGPYLVMELLRGCTLARRPDPGPVPVRETLRIAIEVAKGLAHAHAHGVVHRDLTPGNIFLCQDGQVKVLDLGLAHAFGHRKIDGGTPAYMAPEQRRGAPEDERTDVFALGVILFEMLTGELPFPAQGGKSLPESATAPPLAVPGHDPLADLVAQMLSVDPVDRPRDAVEVLAALSALAPGAELEGTVHVPPPAMQRRLPRHSLEHAKSERTCVCSVLSTEIVRYAAQSVEIQAVWKARFNARLASSIREVPESERVILDSGGSVAVCFLGDPEAALSGASGLFASLAREDVSAPGMRLRAGLHLGPVKLVRDINGNLNAVGEGLSLAQRTMAFAHENQVLASRSFHEVASCLSAAYRSLFTHAGVRRDELMREHALYELRLPGGAMRGSEATRSLSEEMSTPTPAQDAGLKAAIVDRAARILGPIAHHLARTVGARSSDARELAEALAAFMPQSAERAAFLRSCGGVPPTQGTSLSVSPSIATLSADVLDRAARQLAEYLGPMARILVSRTSLSARSEEELYDLLAREIDSPDDRAAFRGTRPVSG